MVRRERHSERPECGGHGGADWLIIFRKISIHDEDVNHHLLDIFSNSDSAHNDPV